MPHQASGAGALDTLTVEEVRSETALRALEREWDDLLARSENNVLFMTHEWVTCWWQHFGRPRSLLSRAELFVLTVRRHGRLCAVAPLMVEVERFVGISARIVRFVGQGMSDYVDFLLAEDRDALLEAIVQHLISRSAAWDVIDLRDFYGALPNLPILRTLLGAAGCVWRTECDQVCPFLPIEGPWETFYHRQFNSQRRNRHRREWRQLELAGRIRVRFVTALEDAPDLLERLAAIERHHPEAESGRPGLLNLDRYREFLEDFLPWAARRGWLTIALLECNDCIVAYYLGFWYHGRWYLYMTSYIREFGTFGVGRLLMLRMLEHYWLTGGEAIDFLRGDELYKHDWAVQTHQNWRLLVAQRPWRSRARKWLWYVLLPALQRRLPRVYGVLAFASENGWRMTLTRVVQRFECAVLGMGHRAARTREEHR